MGWSSQVVICLKADKLLLTFLYPLFRVNVIDKVYKVRPIRDEIRRRIGKLITELSSPLAEPV
jgi:hypothetical protein